MDAKPSACVKKPGLSRKYRIRKRKDFLRVQRSGIRAQGAYLALIGRKTAKDRPGRIGLTVSKAVGKAHVRNLVKRRLRSILQDNPSLFESYDLVVVALPSAALATFDSLRSDLLRTAQTLMIKMTSRLKDQKSTKQTILPSGK